MRAVPGYSGAEVCLGLGPLLVFVSASSLFFNATNVVMTWVRKLVEVRGSGEKEESESEPAADRESTLFTMNIIPASSDGPPDGNIF
jgi:hypothetical protein